MKKIIFVFALIIGGFSAHLLAQTADLKCNFIKGETYLTSIKSSQTAGVMGMELPQEMLIEAEMEVLDVSPNGEATLKMTYTRLKFEQDNPMAGKGTYDSSLEDQPQDELSQMFKQMFSTLLNESLTYKLDKRGKILEVLDGSPTLKSSFENQANSFHVYPDRPLKIGESWTNTQKQGAGESAMIIEGTYTLKAKEGDHWIVEIVSQVKNEAGEDIGNSKGEIKIKADNAFLAESIVAQNIEKMKSNGMDVSIVSDNVTTVSKK